MATKNRTSSLIRRALLAGTRQEATSLALKIIKAVIKRAGGKLSHFPIQELQKAARALVKDARG